MVKLGTKNLTSGPYTLDLEALGRIAEDVAKLRTEGYEIALVTSGAIAAGMGRMGITSRPKSVPELQALAAIGQNLLMDAWDKVFRSRTVPIGQVLLTIDDINHRKRYVTVKNALDELFRMDVVPIINENDTVGTEEVKVGDNDNLSAYVSGLVNAELLILLTDVEGLYDRHPDSEGAVVIPLVERITQDIERNSGGAGDKAAVGGMKTKIEAAKRVLSAGSMMLIAHGRNNRLYDLVHGAETGTLFKPADEGLTARRHWIKMSAKVRGSVTVDQGAADAVLDKNASLLAKGITGSEGLFDIGDVIAVIGPDGSEIARGLAQYDHLEIQKIRGIHSGDIAKVLGYDNGSEIIHRNDLVTVRQVNFGGTGLPNGSHHLRPDQKG